MRYCDIAERGWHARAAQANPALDVSFAGLRLVETLPHAWGIARDDDTRFWVELVCRPATNRTGR